MAYYLCRLFFITFIVKLLKLHTENSKKSGDGKLATDIQARMFLVVTCGHTDADHSFVSHLADLKYFFGQEKTAKCKYIRDVTAVRNYYKFDVHEEK